MTTPPKQNRKTPRYFVTGLFMSTFVLIVIWPVFALYCYAPLVFLLSPSPFYSERLGKVSYIELGCHKTWIWGYYATDVPWEQTLAFYKGYGYTSNSGSNQYLSRSEQGYRLLRQVGLFDRQSIELLHDEILQTNITKAFDAGHTVFIFSLTYTENIEAFEHSSCRGD